MSKPISFQGVIPYLVSPFDPRGRLLRRPFARLIDDLVAAGVTGLSPLGSTGEFAYLDAARRAAVVDATIEAAAGRVPVLPNVAASGTLDAARQAERYAKAGAAGLVVTMTTYFPPSPASIVRFFTELAAATSLPLIIYTNPAFMGYRFTPEVLGELLALPTVRYLKDASGNTAQLASLRRRFGDRLGVFAASAHLPVPVLQLGGLGLMSGPAGLLPREHVALDRAFRAGDTATALALQQILSEIAELFIAFDLAACVKGGLRLLGYEVGDPIAPQLPLTEAQAAQLRGALDRVRANAAQVLQDAA